MPRALSFAWIGLFLWVSSASAAGGGPPIFDALAEALERARSESGCIGASAAVILSSGETWRGVSGWSDPVTSDPITPDMLFDMGSAGKNLLATLMVKLAEEGLLSLDDPIDRYLSPFPHVDDRITIRQLLNHTSGLYMPVEHPDSPFRKPYNSIEFDKWWTLEEIFDRLIEEPYFPPGGGWHYTQTGYYLGVLIIEQVTHSTVPREIQHRLLDPLNIDGMLLDLSQPVPSELKVAHHWVDTDGNGLYEDVSSRSLNWICSLSRILYYATPEALARWMHALFNEQVVNRNSIREMLQFISPTPGEPMLDGYGLGTLRIIVDGAELWGHGGSIPGYRTLALHSPEYGSTISLMINTDGDPVMDDIAFPLLATWLEHLR